MLMEVFSYFRPSINGIRSYKRRTKHYIHRVVWESFNGQIPEGLEIHHIDELTNLTLVTRKDNMKLMLKSNPHVLKNLRQY